MPGRAGGGSLLSRTTESETKCYLKELGGGELRL